MHEHPAATLSAIICPIPGFFRNNYIWRICLSAGYPGSGFPAFAGDVQPAAGFGTFGHCRGENEFVELPVVGIQDVVLVAFPPLLPFVDEDHVFADLEHRVHVVRVDDRGDVVLLGDLLDQVVDHHRGHRVEARIGLVAEEGFGVHHDRACDGYALDHTAAQLGGVEVVHILEVDPLQAKIHAFAFLFRALVGEQVERQAHVLFDRGGVEQCAALEDHADLLADRLALGEREGGVTDVVVIDLPAVDRVEPDQRFEQHGFARSALADDQVRDAGRELGRNVVEYDAPVEGFYDVFGSDHVM